jgi:PiT family inorganic phosphate transporter
MTDFALPVSMEPAKKRPNLDKGFNPLTMILFGGILAGGLLFVAYSLYVDIDAAGTKVTSYVPFLLLFVALAFLLSVVAGSFAAVILGSYGIAQLIASAL